MDAYEILRANSTAPAGSDVWTLINTQEGGGAGNIYVGGILTMNIAPSLSMESDSPDLTMNIKPSLSMNLETDELSVNISNDKSMDSGI